MQGFNVMRSTHSDFEIGVWSIPVLHVYNCQRLADTRFVNFFCADFFKENTGGNATISPHFSNRHPKYYVMEVKIRKNKNWSILLRILHQY